MLASFSVNIVHAQVVPWVEWSQSYGGFDDDRAYSVVATSDGGFAFAGDTYSFGMGKNDFWLIKTDSLGNMLWNRTYGGSDYDACYSMIVTSDGGFALAGYSWSFGNGLRDFWLVKTDGDGNVEWNQTYGGEGADYAYSVCQTSDRGFVLAGVTHSFGADESDAWLVKTDEFGNAEWKKTYGSSALEGAYCMVKTSDGGYALAGHQRSDGVGYGYVWLIKTDSSGNLEWDQTYGGEDGDRAVDLVQASDGGYALACLKYSARGPNDPPENDLPDFWLIKTDGSGNLEWDKTYGGEAHDLISSIIESSDGGFALAGYTRSFGYGNPDFWLVKTDSFGNKEWDRFYGTSQHEVANSVIQNADGGYTLAGYVEFWELNDENYFERVDQDFWVVKTNGQGVPEFPSWIALPLFLVATFSVILFRKRIFQTDN